MDHIVGRLSDTLSPFGGKVLRFPGETELSGRKLELFDRDKLCTFSPRLLSKDCFGFALDGLKLFVVRLQDEKIVYF